MNKKIIGFGIGVLLFLFMWMPWWIPNRYAYISKGVDPEYVPLFKVWAFSAASLLFFFALIGIASVVNFINEWISENN